jgi:hypothetical protein
MDPDRTIVHWESKQNVQKRLKFQKMTRMINKGKEMRQIEMQGIH